MISGINVEPFFLLFLVVRLGEEIVYGVVSGDDEAGVCHEKFRKLILFS